MNGRPLPPVAPTTTPQPLGPRSPRDLRELFVVFTRLALQGFGGVLPVAYHELVERQRWLHPQAFAEWVALAQVLPGPNVVNLSWMLGDRWFGWRGALAAAAGLLLAPLALLLVAAGLVQQALDWPAVRGALSGMGAVSAGLVAAMVVKLARDWPRDGGLAGRLALAAAGFVAIGLLRWPLLPVLLALGGVGTLLAWRDAAR